MNHFLRYYFLGLILAVIVTFSILGFRGHRFTEPPFEIFPDMNYQQKVKDQTTSDFFADGQAARPPIPGTIAQEMPVEADYWSTGKWDAIHWGDGIPVHGAKDGLTPLQVDDENMRRGQERYAINCAVCHGATGAGNGITSKYGLVGAASYHNDRIRQMSDGELFNVVANGKGQMMGYGYNIGIDDRWRIVMYVRALQRSQYAAVSDASPSEQQTLLAQLPPPAPATNTPAATPPPQH